MWCLLPDSVKNCWIEAGKTIYAYDELAKTIPSKVSIPKFIFKLIDLVFVIIILLNLR